MDDRQATESPFHRSLSGENSLGDVEGVIEVARKRGQEETAPFALRSGVV